VTLSIFGQQEFGDCPDCNSNRLYYRVGGLGSPLTAFVHRAISVEEMSATVEPRPMQAGPLEADRVRFSAHPEFDLLAALCTTAWSSQAGGRSERLFQSGVNWEKLLGMAELHGLTPLLLEHVEVSPEHVPAENLDALRSTYRQNAYRALWFAHELGRILESLYSAGIEALAHKGPALSVKLYGDVTRRQFHDLDLLIGASDVSRATSVLDGMGYECGVDLDPLEEKAHLESGYERVFHSSHGKNLLELQWRILPHFYAIDFDMKQLFARSQEIKIGSQVCKMISDEDLLLALCVHAAKHVWTQMSWLRDITQLAKIRDLDWGFIEREAERLGIRRIVAVNFWLADRLFGCGLPACFERWRDGEATFALTTEISEIMQAGGPYQTESFAYFHLMMRLRERRRDRARLLWRLASTPGIGEWKSVRLPSRLFPMYSLVRVGRLARRLAFEL
jgi:Uncharacterised nucleotidyltransferase